MRLFEGTQWDVPPRCERCDELDEDCKCAPAPPPANIVEPSKQRLVVRMERRKRGKVVTVVRGLADDDARKGLLKDLKNLVGSGGTLNENGLEVQGEHVEKLCDFLKDLGYRVADSQ